MSNREGQFLPLDQLFKFLSEQGKPHHEEIIKKWTEKRIKSYYHREQWKIYPNINDRLIWLKWGIYFNRWFEEGKYFKAQIIEYKDCTILEFTHYNWRNDDEFLDYLDNINTIGDYWSEVEHQKWRIDDERGYFLDHWQLKKDKILIKPWLNPFSLKRIKEDFINKFDWFDNCRVTYKNVTGDLKTKGMKKININKYLEQIIESTKRKSIRF